MCIHIAGSHVDISDWKLIIKFGVWLQGLKKLVSRVFSALYRFMFDLCIACCSYPVLFKILSLDRLAQCCCYIVFFQES